MHYQQWQAKTVRLEPPVSVPGPQASGRGHFPTWATPQKLTGSLCEQSQQFASSSWPPFPPFLSPKINVGKKMSSFLASWFHIWPLFHSKTVSYLRPLLDSSVEKPSAFFKQCWKFLTGRTSIFEVPKKLQLKVIAIQTSNIILTGNLDL